MLYMFLVYRVSALEVSKWTKDESVCTYIFFLEGEQFSWTPTRRKNHLRMNVALDQTFILG